MKKLFAILLAAMLAMGCFSASAESAKFTFHVNENTVKLLGLSQNTEYSDEIFALRDALLPVLNALSLEIKGGDDAGQIDLCLADRAVASIRMGMSGEKLALASELFPNYVLTVSEEEMLALLPQSENGESLTTDDLAGLLEAMDMDEETIAVIQDLIDHVTEETASNAFYRLINAVGSNGTLPEEGEFVLAGKTYTTKMGHEMSSAAALTILVNFISDLAPGSMLETKIKAAAADTLYRMLSSAESDPFETPYEMALYLNEDETAACMDFRTQIVDRFSTLNLLIRSVMEDNSIHVQIGLGGEGIDALDMIQTAAVSGLTDEAIFMDMVITPALDGSNVTAKSELYNAGECVGLSMTVQTEPEITAQFGIHYPTASAELFTYGLTVSEEKVALPAIDLAGKTEITLTQLMTDDSAAEGWLNDLEGNALNVLLSEAMEAMPEEINALIEMIAQAMAQETEAE